MDVGGSVDAYKCYQMNQHQSIDSLTTSRVFLNSKRKGKCKQTQVQMKQSTKINNQLLKDLKNVHLQARYTNKIKGKTDACSMTQKTTNKASENDVKSNSPNKNEAVAEKDTKLLSHLNLTLCGNKNERDVGYPECFDPDFVDESCLQRNNVQLSYSFTPDLH